MLLNADVQVGRADEADDRGLLDQRDEFVAQRGQDVLDRLAG